MFGPCRGPGLSDDRTGPADAGQDCFGVWFGCGFAADWPFELAEPAEPVEPAAPVEPDVPAELDVPGVSGLSVLLGGAGATGASGFGRSAYATPAITAMARKIGSFLRFFFSPFSPVAAPLASFIAALKSFLASLKSFFARRLDSPAALAA
ncbi:hypothetical protein BJF85_05470 [Saccharomonospora sp. CUA-673]|nr:hypothetical protein BJF85_05470 [Saccharomonospora sp. CUA-673]